MASRLGGVLTGISAVSVADGSSSRSGQTVRTAVSRTDTLLAHAPGRTLTAARGGGRQYPVGVPDALGAFAADIQSVTGNRPTFLSGVSCVTSTR